MNIELSDNIFDKRGNLLDHNNKSESEYSEDTGSWKEFRMQSKPPKYKFWNKFFPILIISSFHYAHRTHNVQTVVIKIF